MDLENLDAKREQVNFYVQTLYGDTGNSTLPPHVFQIGYIERLIDDTRLDLLSANKLPGDITANEFTNLVMAKVIRGFR